MMTKKKKIATSAKAKASVLPALICPPDAAGRSLTMRLLGYLCRMLVVFAAVNGVTSLVTSAFKLSEAGATFLPVLLAVLILAVVCYRWYTAAIGSTAIFGVLLWHLLQQDDALTYIDHVVTVVYNAIMRRLYSLGYYSYISRVIKLPITEFEQEELLADGVVALCWLFALLFVPFLIRRIRIVVPLIVSVATLMSIFTFNIPVSNWAVTSVIAGFAAILIMYAYQCLYDKKNNALVREKHALFVDDRPEVPERLRAQAEQREQEKESRAERRERRRERRATGLVTVEDELNDYLDLSSNRRSQKQPALSPEEEERKRERAQLAAVRKYDRIGADARLAMGGFAGFAMLLLSFILLFFPTVTVQGAFNTIESIDRRMNYYREYVTAVLRGDDPVMEMYAYGEEEQNFEPHDTTAETQVFQNLNLMRIYSQFDNNLYMQGWLGVDYIDGAWHTANDDYLAQWRDLYDVQDMPSELTFERFCKLFMPAEIVEEELYEKYYSYEEYGFVAYVANVLRLRSIGTELYLPRVTSEAHGVLEYRSLNKHLLPYANFFDGVMVGSQFDEQRADYSALVYAPMQLDDEWYHNVAALIAAYNNSEKEIARYNSFKNKRAFKSSYTGTFDPSGNSIARSYVEDGDKVYRAMIDRFFEEANAYSDFVYNTYTSKADSEIIRALAQEILTGSYPDECYADSYIDEETGKRVRGELLPGAQPYQLSEASLRDALEASTYEQRHLLTMAVINRLVDDCTYTLTITKEGDPTLCGVENFLTVTKEGYCVQFASAAALLLRELDIPVRYVEGYICNEYTRRVYADDDLGRFVGDVQDNDKHAWIEVWYDGIGWIVYETTPAYYVDLYGKKSTSAEIMGPVITTPDDTPDKPDDDPSILPPVPPVDIPGGNGEEIPFNWEALIKGILLTLAVLLVLITVIVLIVRFLRKAKRAQEAREQLAKDTIARAEHVFDTEEHRAEVAAKLVRQTLELLALYGTAPEKGELREAYAKRISFAYEDTFGYPMEYADGAMADKEIVSKICIGDILEAVAAEEFGYGMPADAMADLAQFYLTLITQKRKRLPVGKRLYLHYFKRVI